MLYFFLNLQLMTPKYLLFFSLAVASFPSVPHVDNFAERLSVIKSSKKHEHDPHPVEDIEQLPANAVFMGNVSGLSIYKLADGKLITILEDR